MTAPTLSIVIPLYRSQRFVDRSIEQLTRSWTPHPTAMEVVFVDDASGDGTLEVFRTRAERALPGPTKFIQRSTNGRAMAARKTGAEQASGNYLIFCDVDDTWGARYFEECLEHVRSGADPSVLLRPIDYTIDQSDVIHKAFNPQAFQIVPGDEAVQAYVRRQLGLGAMWGRMIRRDLWLKCAELEADLPVFIDSDLTFNFRIYHEADAVHILPGDAYSWLQTGISAHDDRQQHLAMMMDRVVGLEHVMNWLRPRISAAIWQEVMAYKKRLFEATIFAATSWDQICLHPPHWSSFLAERHPETRQLVSAFLREYFARPAFIEPPPVVRLNLATPCRDIGQLPVMAQALSTLRLDIQWTCVFDSDEFPSVPELPPMPVEPRVMMTGGYSTLEASFNRLLGGRRWGEHFAVLPSDEAVPVAYLNALAGRPLDYAEYGKLRVLSYRAIGNHKISTDDPEALETFHQEVKRNSRSSWFLFR